MYSILFDMAASALEARAGSKYKNSIIYLCSLTYSAFMISISLYWAITKASLPLPDLKSSFKATLFGIIADILQVYGYLPNKAANYFFCIAFGLSCIAHFFQAGRSRSWTFMIAFGVGAFGEAVGYVGRILLRKNPFSREYLTIMLVPGTVAPAFLAGGIYLTLKHIIIIYGRKFSRIAPRLYTWIFVFADIASIVIQSLGAVIASRGTKVSVGNNIMMVGLCSQVATLAIFGLLSLDVFFKIRSYRGQWNASTISMRSSGKFKGLLFSIVVAYCTITIRCIYRIAEMSGGWRNPIMQNETGFIVLDSVMCLIACVALNIFHPGFLFKQSYATIKAEAVNGPAEDMEQV